MREKGRNAQEAEKMHPSKITAALSWSDAALLIFFVLFPKMTGFSVTPAPLWLDLYFCHSSRFWRFMTIGFYRRSS